MNNYWGYPTRRGWIRPLLEGKMEVTRTDLARAVSDFTAATGTAPRVIQLNPKYEKKNWSAPAGLEVRYDIGGVASWEIWLAGGKENKKVEVFPMALPKHATKQNDTLEIPCDNGLGVEITLGGGVTAQITERIRVLAGKGLSCRAIEEKLRDDGITMSYRTIARRLQSVMFAELEG